MKKIQYKPLHCFPGLDPGPSQIAEFFSVSALRLISDWALNQVQGSNVAAVFEF